MKGAYENLDEIVAGLLRQKEDPFEKFLDAPCAPALAAVLNNLDLIVERQSGGKVRVIHDETASFGPALTETFQLPSGGPEVRIGVNNGNYFRFAMERFVGFELRRSNSTPMLQAADVLAGVMRAGAEDALLTDWSRMVDLRATFEELIVEGSYGEVPHFMLSQPMFERLVHPQLARDVTTRARLLRDPL